MKKMIAILLTAMMVFCLTACNNPTNGNGTGTNSNNNGSTPTSTAYKTGLGMAVDMAVTAVESDAEGGTKANITTCAATMGTDGKLISVSLDTIECKSTVNATGNITVPETFKSKKALGNDYDMKKNSPIGKEWYEQVAALEYYCIGKTPDEVAGMTVKTVEGRADVPDVPELTSSCTISCTQFFEALKNAGANAK